MPDPVLPSRYELMMAALRGDPLPSEDPATPYSLLKRPPRAPDVALPKDPFPGWFAKLMAGVEGATGIPIGPNPEHYETGGENLQGYSDLGELGSMLLGPFAAGAAMTRQGIKQTVRAGARRISNPIKAHHGSPHDFDEFDLTKMGTGEGSQAFSQGGYFAENPAVGKGYQKALSGKLPEGWAQKYPESARAYIRGMVGDVADGTVTAEQAAKHIYNANASMRSYPADQLAAELSDAAQKTKGRMYEVNLHVRPEELLDWDQPLSAQTPQVTSRLRTVVDARYGKGTFDSLARNGADPKDLFANFDDLPEGGMEGMLNEGGVPGVQYLDAGSRGRTGGTVVGVTQTPEGWQARVKVGNRGGTDMFTTSTPYKTEAEARAWADQAINTGTRNFVIYDDQLVDIRRKYGFATTAAAAEWIRQQGGTVEQRGADQ